MNHTRQFCGWVSSRHGHVWCRVALSLACFGAPQCYRPAAAKENEVIHAATGQIGHSEQSVVQPVAGILDGLFNASQSRGETGGSKKDKEEGRKAYALPAPDPSTVNWQGVPFHSPKTPTASATAKTNQPLRDPSAAAPRQPAATAPPQRNPVPTRFATADSRVTDQVVPRVVSSVPRPTVTVPSGSGTRSGVSAEFSDDSSSRRSDRRNVQPLNASETAAAGEGFKEFGGAAEVPVTLSEPGPPVTATPVPQVSRRELVPIDRELDTPPSAATESELAKPRVATLPMVPPALSRETPRQSGAVTVPQTSIPELQPLPEDAEPLTPSMVGSGTKTDGNTTKSTPHPAIGSGVADSKPTTSEAEADADAGFVARGSDGSDGDGDGEIAAGSGPPEVPKMVPISPVVTDRRLAASELPGIRVVTEGPSEIMIRELTQYEVRVENRGSIDAKGIVIRTSLPEWAEVRGHNASLGTIKQVAASGDSDASGKGPQGQLQWTIDKLPAGVVERLFIRVRAVRSGTFDVATHWTALPQTHLAKVLVREPKLAIQIDGPDEIVHGQAQKYKVRVLNPGDALASNVIFTLASDGDKPQSQPLGDIPPGKEAAFEIELTARDSGMLKIAGAVSADLDLRETASKQIQVATAKLEATLAGPQIRFQNTEATYQLQLSNTGRATSQAVSAELQLPAGVKYVSGIKQARLSGSKLSWRIDAMPPGEVREYEFVCTMESTGEQLFSFNCQGTANGRASVSIGTTVDAIADLKLSVSDPIAPAPVGAEVAYEVVLNNRGSKAAEDIRVIAQFGHGIEPVRVEGQVGEVVTGQVLFNPIARIEAGSQIRLRVIAKADRAGDHRFRAEVRAGETVLVAEEATVFMMMRDDRISRRSVDEKR